MSRFIDSMEVVPLGKLKQLNETLGMSITAEPATPTVFRLAEAHDFEVRWRARVYVPREDGAFEAIRRNVMLQLREAVYGEFRHRVMRLERAIYEEDCFAARQHISDILKTVAA